MLYFKGIIPPLPGLNRDKEKLPYGKREKKSLSLPATVLSWEKREVGLLLYKLLLAGSEVMAFQRPSHPAPASLHTHLLLFLHAVAGNKERPGHRVQSEEQGFFPR